MLPYFTVFGRQIQMYGLMAMLGVFSGYLAIFFLSKKSKLQREDCLYGYIYALIGAFIGAKVLYLILSLGDIINNFSYLVKNPQIFLSLYIYGGFVFYGGLFGALLGLLIYCRKFHLSFFDFINPLLPTLPLIHAMGRIGCFLAGCCYGIPVSPQWGISYTISQIAPNNIPLFPVQLVESACEFIIFAFLIYLEHRRCRPQKLLAAYLILYAVVRFILEYFRYDSIRGFIYIFSVSQVISIAAIIGGMVLLLYKAKKNPQTPANDTAVK